MNVVKRAILGSAVVGWIMIGRVDNSSSVKKYAFIKGYNLSQKFKKYGLWDSCLEPLIVKQSCIIFMFGNSFIKGMISDNDENQRNLIMEKYKKIIEEELKE